MTRHAVRFLSAALAAVVSLVSVSAQTPAAPDATREGRRVFVKVGWSEKLLEGFSWRLEAIRK